MLTLLAAVESVCAEILNSSTPLLRIRLGSNGGAVDTVEYNAGIPASMGGLPGVSAQPETISSNNVSGSNGVYKVRVVTDVNARPGIVPLRGEFRFDSSTPMACITPASCGASTILFTRIGWNARDNDTWNTIFRYDGSANQLAQVQVDSDTAVNRAATRHRNYFQFVFDNVELLPAGTYEGLVNLTGRGQW